VRVDDPANELPAIPFPLREPDGSLPTAPESDPNRRARLDHTVNVLDQSQSMANTTPHEHDHGQTTPPTSSLTPTIDRTAVGVVDGLGECVRAYGPL